MLIYLVSSDSYDDYSIWGFFSSEEKAREYIKDNNMLLTARIETHELDSGDDCPLDNWYSVAVDVDGNEVDRNLVNGYYMLRVISTGPKFEPEVKEIGTGSTIITVVSEPTDNPRVIKKVWGSSTHGYEAALEIARENLTIIKTQRTDW